MVADLQPSLANAVVELRPLVAGDWTALSAVAADPLIWAGHPAHDRWLDVVFANFFAEAMASGGALVAIDPGSKAIIGSSRFDTERAGPGEVEIGWTFLARSAWGGRVNAAMKGLMIGHALESFERCIFLVGETNLRSRRAMEKIGGRLTARVHEGELAGAPVRHLIYGIDRADFAAGPLGAGAGVGALEACNCKERGDG